MRYTINLCRKIGTNVLDILFFHTYSDYNEFMDAVNNLENTFKYLHTHRRTTYYNEEDFTKAYIEVA